MGMTIFVPDPSTSSSAVVGRCYAEVAIAMNRSLLLLVASSLLVITALGCHSPAGQNASATRQQPVKAQSPARVVREQQATDTAQIDEVPPPSKTRYLSIRSKALWQNPFLIVSEHSVTLTVTDFSQSPGGRKRTVRMPLSGLPKALAVLSDNSWPYGRVIAYEENPVEIRVRRKRVQVRRNVESTLNMLNNLGVVAYEWPGPR